MKKIVISLILLSTLSNLIASTPVKSITNLTDAKVRIQYLESKLLTTDIKVMQLESDKRVLDKANQELKGCIIKLTKDLNKQQTKPDVKTNSQSLKNQNEYKHLSIKRDTLIKELKLAESKYRDFKFRSALPIKSFSSARRTSNSKHKKQPRGRARSAQDSRRKSNNSRDKRPELEEQHLATINNLKSAIRKVDIKLDALRGKL